MVDQVCLNELLLESVKEVFETMIFMDVDRCSDAENDIEGDVLLGSITFMGDLEGCLAICCGDDCAKTISANMLGLGPDDEVGEDDISDAIGEVANMVMGSLKARLLKQIGNLEVSIPSVVSGRKLQNSLGDGASKILVQINIEDTHVAELSLLYRETNN